MTDSLSIALVDDYGPEQGLITTNQMTDDPTPVVRVWLTTGSGAAIQAGETIKVSDMGTDVGQAAVSADDVARGYVDVAAHYVKSDLQPFTVGAYDSGGAQVASGTLQFDLAPTSGVLRTDMTDGGHTVSYTFNSSIPFYTALVQRYDPAGHTVGQMFMGQYESGQPSDYSITPLYGGNYVALFLDGDHFTNRKGPVVDAHGAVLTTITTGFNAVATAGAAGGFLTKWVDVVSTGDSILHTYDNAGASMSNDLHMLGPVTSVVAEAGGRIDVNWDDFGASRTLVLDPLHASTLTGPAPTSLSAWDDYGPQMGQITTGGTTDDATPTFRVAVREAGEVVVSLSHGSSSIRTEVHTTDADIARGYVEVTMSAAQGDGAYAASARFLDADGLTTPRADTSFTLQTSPPPSGGQVLRGQDGGSNLQGGSGDDTLIGGSGPDTMTGGGGGDHFAWNAVPYSPGHVTDFTDGTDRLDLSALLSAANYSGSDPVADGYVKPIDDGSGNSWIYFDRDGHGSGDPWGSFVTTLDHVPASQITSADLVGGTSTSPPPPPPPAAGGQALQGEAGGSDLAGGSGNDTLTGGPGPDTMTGAGGADHFAWNNLPWSPGHVTDFTDGTDLLDLTGLLFAYHYSGTDPVADGWVKPVDDGHGNTWLYFDTDGHGSADPWGSFIATLDHVPASAITRDDLVGGNPTSPPPPNGQGVVLSGQNGGSNLTGGPGNDTLDGGTGPDTMTGGAGADQFVWNPLPWSPSRITDFADGTDHINLSGLLAAYHYQGSDPIGDGYVRLVDDGQGDTWLYFDTDGHGSADQWGTFLATIDHVPASSLSASDFIFT